MGLGFNGELWKKKNFCCLTGFPAAYQCTFLDFFSKVISLDVILLLKHL